MCYTVIYIISVFSLFQNKLVAICTRIECVNVEMYVLFMCIFVCIFYDCMCQCECAYLSVHAFVYANACASVYVNKFEYEIIVVILTFQKVSMHLAFYTMCMFVCKIVCTNV